MIQELKVDDVRDVNGGAAPVAVVVAGALGGINGAIGGYRNGGIQGAVVGGLFGAASAGYGSLVMTGAFIMRGLNAVRSISYGVISSELPSRIRN